MARYFFHTQTSRYVADETGTDLPDDAAARKAGAKYLTELLKDHEDRICDVGGWEVIVENAAGEHLFTFEALCQVRAGEAGAA